MPRKLKNTYVQYDVTKASRPPSTSIENLEQRTRPCSDLRSMVALKHLKLAYFQQAFRRHIGLLTFLSMLRADF